MEVIDVPEIDTALLEGLVHDRLEGDRVILESEAIDAAFEMVRPLTARHFEVLGEEELDADLVAGILADPAAHRGKPYLVRGWIDTVHTQKRSLEAPEEYLGRLVLEDRSVAYFLTTALPEKYVDGGFVRLDGLFLKSFSAEDEEESGKWIDGPLIVGPRLIRSYPALKEVNPQALMDLEDAVIVREDGSINPDVKLGLPFESLWNVMAFGRDLPEGAVDWAEAPELDNALLMDVMKDGASHRLQPFRFPICRIQHATAKRAGENPARMEWFSEGWIGNVTWNNVVFFKSPLQDRRTKLADYATAKGFFFKNFAYQSAGKGVRVAPVFILYSLDVLDPKPEPIFAILAYSLAGLTVLFIAFFIIQLRRDRMRSLALQEKLVQRRHARRNQAGPAEAPTP